MAVAQAGGAELYYESTGAGAPVLLVMGLGMTAAGWWRTVPVLAERLRVIAFDNRGMGRSSRPPGPYSTTQLADDAMAVLDAAGEESAHVYGLSLGGMIAQEIALRHPARVRSLVLGATTPGGPGSAPPVPEVLAFFQRRGSVPYDEAMWASVPYNYAPRTRERHADRIGEDIAERLRFPFEPAPYRAQLDAAMRHDAHRRLRQLRAPTLVVHGGEDRMVPPANAKLLARAIAGAELRVWPEAAHLYPTDEPQADREILAWILAQT